MKNPICFAILVLSSAAGCGVGPRPAEAPRLDDREARGGVAFEDGAIGGTADLVAPMPSASARSVLALAPEPTSSTQSKSMSQALLSTVPAPMSGATSLRLANSLFSPMPGGQLSGYSADTGLDISGFKKPVFAMAAGVLEYAEAGHTRWTGRDATHYTVRLRLDSPISWKEHQITHVYYGHMFSLAQGQSEGQLPLLHVEGGQLLGVSGWANKSPHLHLGLLLDGHVDQDSWSYILSEDEVRVVLGDLKNGQRLPG